MITCSLFLQKIYTHAFEFRDECYLLKTARVLNKLITSVVAEAAIILLGVIFLASRGSTRVFVE